MICYIIPDPDPDFFSSRIPDPEVKKALDPGFQIRIRNTVKNHSNRISKR
jgi:hypothetical protein